MNNKLLIVAINFIIGLIWGLYFNISIALVFCSIFMICIILFKKYKFIVWILIIIISTMYGYYSRFKYENKYKDICNCNIVGVVVSEPELNEYNQKYILKVISVNGDSSKYKGTNVIIKQKIYSGYGSNVQFGNLINIRNGTFEIPEGSRNYKGFSYKKVLESKKIYGTVIVNSKDVKVQKEKCIDVYSMFINNLRKFLKRKIYTFFSGNSASLCCAMLIGDKTNIDEDIVNQFSDASLSHVLALSGMHINYIVVLISYLFMFVGKRKQTYAIIVFIIFFCNLTGNTFSVMRAGIMVIYYMIAKLLHRRPDVLSSMCVGALSILICNPYAIQNISFILSFLATLSIVLFQEKVKYLLGVRKIPANNKVFRFVVDCVSVSLSANILITPVIVIYFHKISFIFIISNLFISIILPIIMPFSIVCLLISVISEQLSYCLGIILNLFYCLLIQGTKFFSNMYFLSFNIKTPKMITIFTYYLVCVLQIIKKSISKEKLINKIIKYTALIYLVISIIMYMSDIFDRTLTIYFIDVGQGDSTVIKTPHNKNLIIDGGGSEIGDYVGKNVVVPYLLNRGISKIDYMIISHFDSDHIGGLFSVMEELKVENIIIAKQGETSNNYERFKKLVKKKKIKVIVVNKGDRIQIEKDLYLDVIWPNDNQLISENILNNNSLVCKIQYKNFSMLFTGDIEEIAEKQIVEQYKNNMSILKSTVLKVGHHGSDTSSTQPFLDIVRPKIALIGVGKNNKFGHPSDVIIKRLELSGARIYRTDQMGEITVKVDKKERLKIKKFIQ